MFGLIGKKLAHSFSKKYFTDKFLREGKSPQDGYHYELFELSSIEELDALLKKYPEIQGLNVTIPYKKEVIPFLDELGDQAQRIGAVNTIKIQDGKKTGFNTDYFGFKFTLEEFLPERFHQKALILGTGGAAQAVRVALEDLNIPFDFASSSAKDETKNILPYSEIEISDYKLLINTTPLGMYPKVDGLPPLSKDNYDKLDSSYFLYDLVYNPEKTSFLGKGMANGAKTMGGLRMLHGQAEAAAKIWGI